MLLDDEKLGEQSGHRGKRRSLAKDDFSKQPETEVLPSPSALLYAMGESNDPKWLAYLYRDHSYDELARWTRSLRYFRFQRAIGGHANDGDELFCALHAEQTELSISGASGDYFHVDELDVHNALRVEVAMTGVAKCVVLPPRPGEHCFSIQ